MAELVLPDTLGGLLLGCPLVDPPARASIALYENLWGTASDAVPGLPMASPWPDASVLPITPLELQARARRLRPGTAPGLDGIAVQRLLSYPYIYGTLAVIANIVLFRGVYAVACKSNRTTPIPKQGRTIPRLRIGGPSPSPPI